MSAQEQAAGGVYVSRPDGDSGVQPSLVTTFSPDHPSHPDNRSEPDVAQAVAALDASPVAMVDKYAAVSREVIGRVFPPEHPAKVDALGHLDLLLATISGFLASLPEPVKPDPVWQEPKDAPPPPTEPAPAFEPETAPAPAAESAELGSAPSEPQATAPEESAPAPAEAAPAAPEPAATEPQASPMEETAPAATEDAPAAPAEDGDDAALVEDIREDLQEAEEKLEKLQQRQGKKTAK